MKIIAFIRYYFYLGINWNWKIATVLLKQEIWGEKKYGINTTGADELKKLTEKGIDISHSTIYMPVSYALLETIFTQLPVTPRNHFLDIGSGKGRALCVAAYNGFNKISGVDFSKFLCEIATQNIIAVQQKFPTIQFAVTNKNILDYDIPGDVDCIFLFNPFDEMMILKVADAVKNSREFSPRFLQIIYANPLYKKAFEDVGFTEVFYSKTMNYFEVSILNFRY